MNRRKEPCRNFQRGRYCSLSLSLSVANPNLVSLPPKKNPIYLFFLFFLFHILRQNEAQIIVVATDVVRQ